MKQILLLGPGYDRVKRLPMGSKPFGAQPDAEELTVLDYAQDVLDYWKPYTSKLVLHDLLNPDYPQFDTQFDEIHAYEVINLLPGPPSSFFGFWRWIFDSLKPGGEFWAIVPHWRSEYIHTWPGPQRVYTKNLLAYLDHGAEVDAKEIFSDWPLGYDLRLDGAWELTPAGATEPSAFHFRLRRPE